MSAAVSVAADSGVWVVAAVAALSALACPRLYRWLEPRVTGWVEGPKQ